MNKAAHAIIMTTALLLSHSVRAQDVLLEPDQLYGVPPTVEALRESISEDARTAAVQIAATKAYLGALASGAREPAAAWGEIVSRSRDYEDWEILNAVEAGIGEGPCPFAAGGQCLISSGEHFPLETALPTLYETVFNRRSCSINQPLELDFTWRRVEEIPEAETRLMELQGVAESGRAVECDDDGDCVTVHPIIYPDALPAVSVELAACRTVSVDGVLGAPSDCVPILIRAGDERYLSVISRTTTMSCYTTASTEFMIIGPRSYPSSVENRLVVGFEGDPLNYNVARNADRIRAVSRYTVSPFLRPFREIATVEVFTSSRPLENGLSATAVFVESSVLVNRHNTRRPQDWRMPDDQQRDAYSRGMSDLIRRNLAIACETELRRVGRYLVCSVSGDVPSGAERAFQEIMFQQAYR